MMPDMTFKSLHLEATLMNRKRERKEYVCEEQNLQGIWLKRLNLERV